ncbi:hypothetical protein GALMADRAFT_162058 [Galerina marginata CBS 339.88]|uniref:Uncharacterized protein n=1 Tax=Galerina marginata (strain CBS 339.88) TaxID=685588 RepID=A0A067S6Q4_GALM3|nr:hypothetical protein GALMADRAFT_162058 [Galerina marginata CBS 339.88]
MDLTMDNNLVKEYLDKEAQAVFIANVAPYYLNALQASNIDTFLLSVAAMWMHKWPDDQRNVLNLLKAVQLDIQRAFILYRPTQANKNKPWTDILSLDPTIYEIVKTETNHMSTRLREWLESVKDIPATDDEDNKSTTSSSSNIYTNGRTYTADGHEEDDSDDHTEKVDLFASTRINPEVEKGLNIPDAHAMPPCA